MSGGARRVVKESERQGKRNEREEHSMVGIFLHLEGGLGAVEVEDTADARQK